MLTCLSFNLTGRSADEITTKYRTLVENVLDDEAARELIGTWKLVWGPVVYADSFIGAKTSVNSVLIASPSEHPEQVIIAIAGTNGNSLMGWMLEDFNVREKYPWPYGTTALKPHISKGIAYGLGKLQGLAEQSPADGPAVTVEDFLTGNPEITQIMVTGHSLGGALASVYSLYLEDTKSDWDTSGQTAINCLTTASQTPGDEDFSTYYGERLSDSTCRVWNSMDIVPHAFEEGMLAKIPAIYEPQIPSQQRIENFIANLQRETEGNLYRHILPEVEGFPSSYMRLDDIAGEKYKTFVDFINNVVNLIKKLDPFRSKSITGDVGFVVHALIQHIFPYFNYFKITEFIKIMCSPTTQSSDGK
ncbi:MAG: hypothetical protein RL693_2311 [Verrucomicrobiota bacterium]